MDCATYFDFPIKILIGEEELSSDLLDFSIHRTRRCIVNVVPSKGTNKKGRAVKMAH